MCCRIPPLEFNCNQDFNTGSHPQIYHVEMTANQWHEIEDGDDFLPIIKFKCTLEILFNFKHGQEIFSTRIITFEEFGYSKSEAFLLMFENAVTIKHYGRDSLLIKSNIPRGAPSLWECPLILNIDHLPEQTQVFLKQLVTSGQFLNQIEA